MSAVPTKIKLAALTVSSGGAVHFGFQLVVTDPSEDTFLAFVKDSFKHNYGLALDQDVLEDVWSVVVAVFFVGAIFGALSIQPISSRIGRRRALMLGYLVNSVSSLLSASSYFINSYELFTLSRITLGFGLALSLGVGALYLAEISPKQCRGLVGMSTGVSVQLGLFTGSLIAMPSVLGSKHLWWCIYAAETVVFITALFFVRLLPDSPGYLMQSGEDNKAKKSLTFFQNIDNDALKLKLDELKRESDNSQQKGMLDVLKDPEDKRKVIVGVVAMFGTAFSGIAAINAFAVDILTSSGLSMEAATLANAGLAFISLVAACLSSLVVEKAGRRPLLLFSNCGILLCNLFVGFLLIMHDHKSSPLLSVSLIVCIAFFLTFFAIGPGPVCYFISSELNNQQARSAAQSWTALTQMCSRCLLLAGFLPLKMAVGSGLAYLILFVAPISLVTVFLYFNLPETKNKDQQELKLAFDDLPAPLCGFGRRKDVVSPVMARKRTMLFPA